MARKPDFLIIGASKAGTRSFCIMLEQHPQVQLTRPREPNYFSIHYDKGWDWYASHFPEPTAGGVFGEKSPSYTHVQAHPEVAERIHRDLPDVKLFYVVRNPVARIESRWMQDRASGRPQNKDDFNNAVRGNLYGIVDTTRYLQQIDVYRRYFPDERIQVVFFEELLKNPNETMAKSFGFLGVDAGFSLASVPHKNPSLGKKEDGKFLSYLRRYLPEDTRRLPVPAKLRGMARDLLKRRVDQRPNWDEATRAWVRQELSEDTRAFLRRYRNNEGYWEL